MVAGVVGHVVVLVVGGVEEELLGGGLEEGGQVLGDLLGGGGLHPPEGLGHGVDGLLDGLGLLGDVLVGGDHSEELIAGGADDVLDDGVVGALHDGDAAQVLEGLQGPGVGGDHGLGLSCLQGGGIAGAGQVHAGHVLVGDQICAGQAGPDEGHGAAGGGEAAPHGLALQGLQGGVFLTGAHEAVGELLGGGEDHLAALAGLVEHEGGLDALEAEEGLAVHDGGGGVGPPDGLEVGVEAFLGEVAQGLGQVGGGPVVAPDVLGDDDGLQVAGGGGLGPLGGGLGGLRGLGVLGLGGLLRGGLAAGGQEGEGQGCGQQQG